MDLVGEHAAATWNDVKRRPLGSLARLSMLGVWISEPKQLQSLKPRSSATITRKFGRFVPCCALPSDILVILWVSAPRSASIYPACRVPRSVPSNVVVVRIRSCQVQCEAWGLLLIKRATWEMRSSFDVGVVAKSKAPPRRCWIKESTTKCLGASGRLDVKLVDQEVPIAVKTTHRNQADTHVPQ